MGVLDTIIKKISKPTEPTMAEDDLLAYRLAFKKLVCMKFAYKIDKGNFDRIIQSFIEGDTLVLIMDINTVPNDVIFMRSLVGKEITPEIEEKVRKMWDEENK